MSDHETDGTRYTIDELLELYRRTERAIARTVAGRSWTPSHTAAVVADQLRGLRRDEGEGPRRRLFDEVIGLTDRLGQLIRRYSNGIRGERELARVAELIPIPSASVGPVCIPCDGRREEIDRLVVTRHCLFLLEAKFQTKSYDIDAHGFLFGGAMDRPYDITYHLAAKRRALKALLDVLEGGRWADAPLRSCLVFMNHQVKVHSSCPAIPWFFAGDLLRFVEQVDDSLFDAAPLDMDGIARAVGERSTPYRIEPELDLFAIYRDLGTLFPEASDEGWREVFAFRSAQTPTR